MNRLILPSPSKVNLYLEVLGRRDDGYHEIRSIAVLTDLCDTIVLERRGRGIAVATTNPRVPIGSENLCYRAADLLMRHCGLRAGVSIRIEKRIPVAGGMGGGSSNAAATLWGLNLMYGLGLSRVELMRLGSALGSDVPLFFSRGAAFVSGRGEHVEELPALPSRWMVVANPGVEIPAGSVYRRLRLPLTSENASITMRRLFESGEAEAVLSCCFNRLEQVVLDAYPTVAALKRLLSSGGAAPVLVSGSGPTVFGMMRGAEAAVGLAAALAESGIMAVACRTLDANPMLVSAE
jgi:4-diphosphocytidyl-2-C-methyl-D-erythritol kinase